MFERTSENQAGSSDYISNTILYSNAAAQDLQKVEEMEIKQFAYIDKAIFNGPTIDTNATI